MKPNNVFLSILGAFCAGLLMTYSAATAQTNPEDQARTILQLFESGQKDSAYALLEPLKKTARFVPAVIYVRAEMTPDDRALGLYKELIAMEPASPWAEKASYQLVVRYAEKRDSLAAYLWDGVLRKNYGSSQFVGTADELLAGIKSWHSIDDMADGSAKGRPGAAEARPATKPGQVTAAKGTTAAKPGASSTTKPAAKPATATAAKPATKGTAPSATKPGAKPSAATAAKPAVKTTPASVKPTTPSTKTTPVPTKPAAVPGTATANTSTTKPVVPAPSDTMRADGATPAAAAPAKPAATTKSNKWFALQVGVFPTKPLAIARAAELKKKKVEATPLPKLIATGKKGYALVVGHYSTLEDANNSRAGLKPKCDCQPFAVEIR